MLNAAEEVVASPHVRRGTETAIMIVDHRLVAATKSQYCSSINRLAEWLKERYPENVTETTEVILPLSEAILLEYMGEITFHRTKKNADGSDMFVSNSTINSFRSALTDYYKQRRVQMDPATLLSLSDFTHGYRRKIGKLKQSGEMSLIEGKQPVTFDGYRFLAANAVKSTKDFKSSIFAHLYLLLCWNLMARSASVGAIMYAHISWVGDALQITIPTHKGDQEGANTYPRNLYANPLTPSICPVLSLAVYVFSQSFTRSGAHQSLFSENENNENRFGKWLALTIKNQASNLAIFGIMLIKIGTHSFRKGVASFLASCPDGPGAISIFLRAGWTLGAVQSRYLFAGQGGKSLIISYSAQSTHHSLFHFFI